MTDDSLIQQARAAALRAYAPYSRFSVGCAIESVDGEVVVGANMENACYRLGICAEISALTAARQVFGLDRVARIAVAGGHVGPDGTLAGDAPVTPCGGCRQAIYEAADLSGIDVEVISSNGEGSESIASTIRTLLPHGFGPASLADAEK
jgi:cytidine deaminase